jgi:phosphopantothenoylcysteine decarboxylase/phosphopantothenate--cysteine ligase
MAHEIVVGVTGGIAAYKTAALVSDLVQQGHRVTVVMTRSAKEFVGPATFAALTGRPVASRSFDREYPLGAHIELARRAELLCVAPATANFLAKAANAIADDLLSTLILCCQCPVAVAPAMNCQMWEHPAVQRNVRQLREEGVHLIDPQEGWLSCRDRGVGRMAEPAAISQALAELIAKFPPQE